MTDQELEEIEGMSEYERIGRELSELDALRAENARLREVAGELRYALELAMSSHPHHVYKTALAKAKEVLGDG